jgi:hypothetical protein
MKCELAVKNLIPLGRATMRPITIGNFSSSLIIHRETMAQEAENRKKLIRYYNEMKRTRKAKIYSKNDESKRRALLLPLS